MDHPARCSLTLWTQAGATGIFPTVSDETRLLEAIHRGKSRAAEELLPRVYDELRRIPTHRRAQEAAGHALQPTARVHEAWLRNIGDGNEQFAGPARFLGVAAEARRRILVESARRKRSLQRGGDVQREASDESHLVLSLRTAERRWTYARAWLRREISG
ncbi:MAG: RNA polymerase subunit sigma [Verrucomicrobiales bacterium]|nr:RNA polymerase subunit sigma [Verrucomicrobiales bacterium]